MNDMDRINHTNYNEWVERFLDAETTLDEEREIYAYFSRPDLPEDARRYRKMFGWYEKLPAQESQPHTAMPKETAKRLPIRILPLRPWQWAGVAAVVAVLLTIGLNLRHSSPEAPVTDDDGYICASYIIRDGKKITDSNLVRAEFDRIQSHMDDYIAAMESRMDKLDESPDDMDIHIDTDNPEIQNFINTAFKF